MKYTIKDLNWVINKVTEMSKGEIELTISTRRLRTTDKIISSADGVIFYIPTEQFGKEYMIRHLKERDKKIYLLEKEIARLEVLLSNSKFIERAPADIVSITWQKQLDAQQELLILLDVDYVEIEECA